MRCHTKGWRAIGSRLRCRVLLQAIAETQRAICVEPYSHSRRSWLNSFFWMAERWRRPHEYRLIANGGMMKTVKEILESKAHRLLSIAPRASVLDALKMMADYE